MQRWILMSGVVLAATRLMAAEPASGRLNLKCPTLGGTQFWSDELLFHDWRIQRNAVTGHHRLLDGHDVRQAWGTLEQCQHELKQIKAAADLPPMRKHAVLVLHGLYGTRGHCRPMTHYLRTYGGYQVFDVAYPSTLSDLAEHGAWFERLLVRLEGVDTVDVVAHSLGTLVVRAYLARTQGDDIPAALPVPKLRKMVMIGPPSQGAVLAHEYGRNKIWELIGGKSGQQLAVWEEAHVEVATPDFPFGIIAGALTSTDNPLIPAPNDGVVTLAESQIPGAADFMTVDDHHLHLMANSRVQRAALRFLQEGTFAEASRSPIPASVD